MLIIIPNTKSFSKLLQKTYLSSVGRLQVVIHISSSFQIVSYYHFRFNIVRFVLCYVQESSNFKTNFADFYFILYITHHESTQALICRELMLILPDGPLSERKPFIYIELVWTSVATSFRLFVYPQRGISQSLEFSSVLELR